jgi:hypothetical protein
MRGADGGGCEVFGGGVCAESRWFWVLTYCVGDECSLVCSPILIDESVMALWRTQRWRGEG